jgi:mannose-6-phosphate isomerase-like protein (cupin superfamily)
MCYGDQGPEINAVYLRRVELPGLHLGRASVRLVSPGSLSGASFGLFRWDMAPHGGGPSPHFHKTFSESFYVLSGSVCLHDGARWVEATEGDFLLVPEWGIHAFRNDSDEPASMLILFAPGAPREGTSRSWLRSPIQDVSSVRGSGRTSTSDTMCSWCDRR